MKYALAVFVMIFGTGAFAQPIFHCEDQPGRASFQGNRCAKPLGEVRANEDKSSIQSPQISGVGTISSEAAINAQADRNRRERAQQRLKAKIASNAETARVNMLMKHLDDHKAAEYAANNRRCREAMRVASLCGKLSGRFTCTDKGFRLARVTDGSVNKRPVMSNDSIFKMEQCALQATNAD